MANSADASGSNTVTVENGSDPPDVPSTKVLTENIVEGGDVGKEIKNDEEDNKSVDEMKGEVMEKEGLEDLKDGVDKEEVEEVKDVQNSSVENTDKGDENLKDKNENKDSGDLKDLKGTEDVAENKEVGQTKEPKEKEGIGETVFLEEQKDEKKDGDEQEKETGVEAKEVEEKKDVRETMHLERKKVANEPKERAKNKVVEEEKGFGETKAEEGKKGDEGVKHNDEGNAAIEATNAIKNSVAEVREVAGGKNNVKASDSAKDNNKKNGISDIKGTGQKEVIEGGKAHNDDNSVELLKDSESKQGVQGINDNEHKMYLDNENDVGNVSVMVKDKGVKARRKPKEILKVKPENVKKKVVDDEKEKENVSSSGLEEGKDDDIEDEDSEDEDNVGDVEKKSGRKKVTTSSKKKRLRGEKLKSKGEVKGKIEAKEKKESGEEPKDLLSSPIDTSSSSPLLTSRERPVRERKVVERLVEVIEKEPNKSVIIEKGQGTPLKDIPNVAYKVARKKPVDLKFLHQTLFGRRGKLVDFKSHILQFSGFAWHESEEKQRARLKEKLDKCVKDDLLDFCDLFDLSVSKTSTKKEEIIVKLVDFLEAPHATTDVILAEKEQSEKSRKRKRLSGGSSSRRSGGTRAKRSGSRKGQAKAEGTHKSKGKSPLVTKDEDGEEDTENGAPDEEDAPRHFESDLRENESSGASDSKDKNEDDDEDSGKGTQDIVESPKKQSPAIRERRTGSNSKKVSSQTEAKSLAKAAPSSNKQLKVKKDDIGEKVFSRRAKKESESPEASDDEGGSEDVEHLGKRNRNVKQSPQQQGSSVSKKRKRTGSSSRKASSRTVVKSPVKASPSSKQSEIEKEDAGEKVFSRKKKDADSLKKSNSKSVVKDNSSGKKTGKGKAISEDQRKSGPSKMDLRKTICETLKEVDFNTATFTDILKKLATHYKMDLTPKKAAIKQMIQEELTKMADEAEDSDEEEGEAEDAGKKETPKPALKKVKA